MILINKLNISLSVPYVFVAKLGRGTDVMGGGVVWKRRGFGTKGVAFVVLTSSFCISSYVCIAIVVS